MGLKETFRQQGGTQLIKQYWQGGAFLTAVSEFLILGHKKTALELLRLSAQYKIKQKLEKKYSNAIEKFQENYSDDLPHVSSNKVWVCWFQGIENAPLLVKKCYQSLQENLKDREIILITSENMLQYADFPDHILNKWKNGQITHTHMTDLLRLELLIRHGGIWIDSTVLCSAQREQIPDYIFDSDLFFYQALKPGRDGQSQIISSWLMSARTNNKILMLTRELCYLYWQTHDSLVDYFLLHDFMSIALEHNTELWHAVVPRDNATPHNLLLRLFDPYDEAMFSAIVGQTPFHKLSYKFSEDKLEKPDTFYRKIFKG